MKTKHTPGPWQFVPEVSEVRTAYPDETSQYGNGTPIVGVYYLSSNWERQSANARLIAAAPELLVALEGLIVAYKLKGFVDDQAAIKYALEVFEKATSEA